MQVGGFLADKKEGKLNSVSFVVSLDNDNLSVKSVVSIYILEIFSKKQ